jgi:hypothetical protein
LSFLIIIIKRNKQKDKGTDGQSDGVSDKQRNGRRESGEAEGRIWKETVNYVRKKVKCG